ncbi:MAG: cobalt-precorrin 5A hydrolase [Eubacteriales bacterium]
MTAILSLTEGGYKLSKKIEKSFKSAKLFTLHPDEKDEKLKLPLKEFTGEIFKRYEKIVFVMAVGITIRVISPYINNKKTDPAVISVDERGRFAVSLLSGHLGGANRVTKKIAKEIGAIPVITTASEVLNTKSVDMIALDEGFAIQNMEDAKTITSLVVNGKKVGVYSKVPITKPLPKEYKRYSSLEEIEKKIKTGNLQGVLIIDSLKTSSFNNIPKAVLIPKKTVIGIGCRRGKSKEEVIEFIKETLNEFNIYEESLFKMATAWVKKDEKGIIEASKKFDAELNIYNKNELEKVHERFEKSKFVEKITGIGNVADSCGFLASNRGENIMKKKKKNGITLSIWNEKGEE